MSRFAFPVIFAVSLSAFAPIAFAAGVCQVSNGQATIEVRNNEATDAADAFGRTLYQVKVKASPSDEYWDANNLSVTKPDQYDGISAEIQPKDKRVYEPAALGQVPFALSLQGGKIVVEKTGKTIGTAKNCGTVDALLGGYALAKKLLQ